MCLCVQVLVGEKEAGKWTRCTEFRCKDLTYTVTGLTEGADYTFRVMAMNDAGPGVPGVTEDVQVKEPTGANIPLSPLYYIQPVVEQVLRF